MYYFYKWVLPIATALAIFAVIIGAVIWLIVSLDSSDKKARQKEKNQFALANTICGAPPIEIIRHSSTWSYGPWIEVKCQDGTIRAIR